MIFITYTRDTDGEVEETVYDWDNQRWDTYTKSGERRFTTRYDKSLPRRLLLRDAFTGIFSPPILELVMLENDSYE